MTLEEQIKNHHKDNPWYISREQIENLLDNAETVEQFQHDPAISMTVSYKLQNGFSVLGRSAVIVPEMFDIEIGRQICRVMAMNQLWQLEGYRMQWDYYNHQLRMESEKLCKKKMEKLTKRLG